MNSMRCIGRHLLLLAALIACASGVQATEAARSGHALATFAGGCFWCMEGPFDELDGVVSTTSGYTGGDTEQPTYEQVSTGTTGHTEAVQIVYDPAQVSYAKLLEVFWRNIDPTTPDRQFCDKGNQYRPAIFYHDDDQRDAVQVSLAHIEKVKTFAEPIQVEISAAKAFFPAEEYHQDFYLKNPVRYRYYRYRCGRDERLEALWGQSH